MSSAEDREAIPPPSRAALLWRPRLPASACHSGDVPDYVDEPVVVDVGRPGVEPAGGRGVGSNDRLGRIRPSVAVGIDRSRH